MRTPNKHISEAVQKIAFDLGYRPIGTRERDAMSVQFWDDNEITREDNEFWSDHVTYPDMKIVTVTEFLGMLDELRPSKKIKVMLNDEYTAIVSRDKVDVGCQSFTHRAVEELYKTVQEIKRT